MYDVVYLEIEFVRYRLIIDFKIIPSALLYTTRTLTDSREQSAEVSEFRAL